MAGPDDQNAPYPRPASFGNGHYGLTTRFIGVPRPAAEPIAVVVIFNFITGRNEFNIPFVFTLS